MRAPKRGTPPVLAGGAGWSGTGRLGPAVTLSADITRYEACQMSDQPFGLAVASVPLAPVNGFSTAHSVRLRVGRVQRGLRGTK